MQTDGYNGEKPSEVMILAGGRNSAHPIQRMALYLSGVLITLCTVAMVAAGPKASTPTTAPPTAGNSSPSTAVPTQPQEGFFDGAAFLGDSVTMALRNYNLKTGALGNATFLCAGSYSVRHAVSTDGLTIQYRGQAMSPQQALKACGAKRVFIMLGMNDLAFGLEETMESWEVLIAAIRTAVPDIEIYIQSATPVYPSFEGKKLNNQNLDAYNAKLKSLAAKKGCVYVEVAASLKDGNGALAERYCSDKQCHLTEDGVRVWLRVLKEVENG